MVQKSPTTTWDVWDPVNHGINYHINWCRISSINSISLGFRHWLLDFSGSSSRRCLARWAWTPGGTAWTRVQTRAGLRTVELTFFYSRRSSIKGNAIAVRMPQKVYKQHGMYYSYLFILIVLFVHYCHTVILTATNQMFFRPWMNSTVLKDSCRWPHLGDFAPKWMDGWLNLGNCGSVWKIFNILWDEIWGI